MTPAGGGRLRDGAARHLRGVRAQWALLLLALLGALLVIDRIELLWRLDYALYDAAMRGAPAADDVVIVAIDDASIAAIGRWPWPRAVHAALLARLRETGARGVALDVIFTEPEAGMDAVLASALTAGPPTVLPLIAVSDTGDGLVERLPVAPLAAAAAALGHAHVEIDRDGVARSVFLREGRGAPTRSHFALALLERVAPTAVAPLRGERHPDLAGAPPDAWVRDLRMMIPFLGPPGHFATLSYAEVLSGAVDAARLRDRWVLVGATAQGLGDAYATPLSRDGRATAGIELGANVLQALRTGNGIVPVTAPVRVGLAALPLLTAFLGFLWLSPRPSLALLAVLWLATLGGSAVLLAAADLWWPPAAALAVLTLAYPLWNWRRLEATQRFLEREFARLMAERTPLAREPALAAAGDGGDALQRRIDLVEAATHRVRDLRRLLTDTIAHLPEAVLVADLDGRVALASPAAAALLGRGPSDAGALVDAPLATLLDAAFGKGRVAPAALPPPPAALELRTAPEDGRAPRDLLLRAAPFLAEDGRRLGTLLSLADVTSLREAQREREDLAHFLSHDLRSPVTSLLALAALQRDPARALAPAPFAERVESLARRSLELADGFLALARAEALDRAAFETFDLRDALQDAVDETWAAARLAQVTLTLAAPRAGAVHGDRGLLARAVTNLLHNAIRHAPAGSTVQVELESARPRHEIRVIDAGPGVEADTRARLFARFQRGPATRTERATAGHPASTGHGLGLALVRVVAIRHGGEAGLRDRRDGRGGSEFYLRVAAAEDA